jgi:hypothetical protein
MGIPIPVLITKTRKKSERLIMAHVSVHLDGKEYDSFLAAIQGDDRLPSTYQGWIENRLKEWSEYLAHDPVVHVVIVHYEEFASYCRTTGHKLSYETLLACAVAKFTGLNL